MLRKLRTYIYTNNIRFGSAALLIAAAFLIAFPPASAGAVIEKNNLDRFKLWNECSHIDFLVTDLSEEVATIGLAKDTIEVAVRSRLRAARLYGSTPEHVSILIISVKGFGVAFSVSFDYHKVVTDYVTKITWAATTWNTDTTGTHGGEANYILSAVAQLTDKFIDEYLRVNADACG